MENGVVVTGIGFRVVVLTGDSDPRFPENEILLPLTCDNWTKLKVFVRLGFQLSSGDTANSTNIASLNFTQFPL